MVDTSNLQSISNSKRRDYLINFVLPESVRLLSSKLQIRSTGKLGKFRDGELNYCDDSNKMTIPSSYYTNDSHDADFILFAGSFNSTAGTIAYATFCVLGNFLKIFLKFFILKKVETTNF